MDKRGWLVNDQLTGIPNTRTFWHDLLSWFPTLEDKTGGYTDYSILANVIESLPNRPAYIIRNGSYFRTLNMNIPTISLIQDVQENNQQQIDVINNSNVVVFNSNYVYEKYKNKVSAVVEICPLGIDFDFWKPSSERHPDVLPSSILFIGSSAVYPKGFDILLNIIQRTNYNFCLVMKDDFSMNGLPLNVRDRVRIFNKVSQDVVKQLINSCVLAVCTSYEETQHLSGIQCGACNIPIIARPVGVYYDNKDSTEWGYIADSPSEFIEKIHAIMPNVNNFKPRSFFSQYSLDVCRANWERIVSELTRQ
jgi:glycosyltransferase involved in cell wall biosynthesis